MPHSRLGPILLCIGLISAVFMARFVYKSSSAPDEVRQLDDALSLQEEDVEAIEATLYGEFPRIKRVVHKNNLQQIMKLIRSAREVPPVPGHIWKGEAVGELTLHLRSNRSLELGLLERPEGEGNFTYNESVFGGYKMAELIEKHKGERIREGKSYSLLPGPNRAANRWYPWRDITFPSTVLALLFALW
jgi:hypothetical protein